MPEQTKTTLMTPESHIKICQLKDWALNLPYLLYRGSQKTSILGCFFPIDLTCDIKNRQFGPVRPTLVAATFNLGLLTPQRNALLWSQFVLAWVQRISNFGPSDRRLQLEMKFQRAMHCVYLFKSNWCIISPHSDGD